MRHVTQPCSSWQVMQVLQVPLWHGLAMIVPPAPASSASSSSGRPAGAAKRLLPGSRQALNQPVGGVVVALRGFRR
jgi:hypothetical protein